MKHARKVTILLAVLVAYFVVFAFVFGGSRLSGDFIPLDKSTVGPNIYASFIWLPIAFIGGWIFSEVRSARDFERHRLLLEEHSKHVDEKLHQHTLHMAKLLGISDEAVADALESTPGDRGLDQTSV